MQRQRELCSAGTFPRPGTPSLRSGQSVPLTVGELPRDVKLDPPSTQEQLGIVLKEGTLDEVRLLRQVVETIFRQIETRRVPVLRRCPCRGKPWQGRGPLVFDGRPRLLPALGYIPAGWPQEAVAQQASQFVVVPEDEFPGCRLCVEGAGRFHGGRRISTTGIGW